MKSTLIKLAIYLRNNFLNLVIVVMLIFVLVKENRLSSDIDDCYSEIATITHNLDEVNKVTQEIESNTVDIRDDVARLKSHMDDMVYDVSSMKSRTN